MPRISRPVTAYRPRRYVHYLRERAKGGVGIIVTSHTVTHFDGDVALSLASYDDRIVEMYQRMAGATHAFDVPLLAQLGHRGRRVADAAGFLGRAMMAPSAVPAPDFSSPMFVPHEMSTGEVETVVASFGAAAARARRGNLDGIEISIGMDYLFPNFLHPHGNRRDDKYGGATLDERMTFLREVLAAARADSGRDRLIGVRMYDDLVDYSMQLEDYVELARLLAKDASVDYFNMWQGIVPERPQRPRALAELRLQARPVRAPAGGGEGGDLASRGRHRAHGLARHRRAHHRRGQG